MKNENEEVIPRFPLIRKRIEGALRILKCSVFLNENSLKRAKQNIIESENDIMVNKQQIQEYEELLKNM